MITTQALNNISRIKKDFVFIISKKQSTSQKYAQKRVQNSPQNVRILGYAYKFKFPNTYQFAQLTNTESMILKKREYTKQEERKKKGLLRLKNTKNEGIGNSYQNIKQAFISTPPMGEGYKGI